jgi:hypothetical protein
MVYAVSDYRVLGFTTSTLGLVLNPVHAHRHTVYNIYLPLDRQFTQQSAIY